MSRDRIDDFLAGRHIENPEQVLVAQIVDGAIDDCRHFIEAGVICPKTGKVDGNLFDREHTHLATFREGMPRVTANRLTQRRPHQGWYSTKSRVTNLVRWLKTEAELWCDMANINASGAQIRRLAGLKF